MRFIDYNGSGGIDPQDIATSVAVETAAGEGDPDRKTGPKAAESGVGCATLVACIALLPLLALAVMR